MSCPDCMAEAAAVNKIDYSRTEYCDETTMAKVYESLCEAGVEKTLAAHAINVMQSRQILFRERTAI